MSSKRELEQELDKIPPEYSYQYIAGLREMHRLFHLGASNEEKSTRIVTNMVDLLAALRNIQPSDEQKAIEIIDRMGSEIDLFKEGSEKVLELIHKIHAHHFPTEKIDHAF
jgi:hypothetical protein